MARAKRHTRIAKQNPPSTRRSTRTRKLKGSNKTADIEVPSYMKFQVNKALSRSKAVISHHRAVQSIIVEDGHAKHVSAKPHRAIDHDQLSKPFDRGYLHEVTPPNTDLPQYDQKVHGDWFSDYYAMENLRKNGYYWARLQLVMNYYQANPQEMLPYYHWCLENCDPGEKWRIYWNAATLWDEGTFDMYSNELFRQILMMNDSKRYLYRGLGVLNQEALNSQEMTVGEYLHKVQLLYKNSHELNKHCPIQCVHMPGACIRRNKAFFNVVTKMQKGQGVRGNSGPESTPRGQNVCDDGDDGNCDTDGLPRDDDRQDGRITNVPDCTPLNLEARFQIDIL